MHAARELEPGLAFSPRDRTLEEFEATFPFEETPDQLAAIDDVLADLAAREPMDRLVCGDVGYGKTEVAMRAAFRVVMDGKQVAVLVPTTVLCAAARGDLPQALRGPSRAHRVAVALPHAEGTPSRSARRSPPASVDIVIGTHRLL